MGRVPVRPVLDEGLWKWARKRAIDADLDASDIVEAGLALVKAIDELGHAPAELLRRLDKRHREVIARLVAGG